MKNTWKKIKAWVLKWGHKALTGIIAIGCGIQWIIDLVSKIHM